ncbi:hypothetical protein [Olleya sp. UBA1516]|uniref:hypothetical protein n=1 Tax=Olleya sp. UBA1516 TaxID=1947013 RepID=UPI0025FDB928|nr:hypothetical protein [Olleya sp. UBA1516]
MRTTLSILILILLLTACGQNNNGEKRVAIEKPIQRFMTFRLVDNELVEYDIDTLKNYNGIIKILDETDCLSEYAIFKLETDDKVYKIQPLQFCESIFDYKLREVLYVNTDSITVNYELKFPIDSLKFALTNHLFNPTNNRNYSLKNEKKLISINVDSTKEINETKKLLLNIIEELNGIENKPNFGFMFENRGILPKAIIVE